MKKRFSCVLCAATLCLCVSCGADKSDDEPADGKLVGSISSLTASVGGVSFALPLAVSDIPAEMTLKNERTRDGATIAECFINDAFFGYVTVSDNRITAFNEDVVIAGCASGDFYYGKFAYGAKQSDIEKEYGIAALYSFATSENVYYFDDGRVILLYAGGMLAHLSAEYGK